MITRILKSYAFFKKIRECRSPSWLGRSACPIQRRRNASVVWKRTAPLPVIGSISIRRRSDTRSPRLSGFGRFPVVFPKSRPWRNGFLKLSNAIASPEKIVSFSKCIYRTSDRSTAYSIVFSFTARPRPRSCNHRRCRLVLRRSQRLRPAPESNAHDREKIGLSHLGFHFVSTAQNSAFLLALSDALI